MPKSPEWNPQPLADTLDSETDKIRDSITTLAGSAIREEREDVMDQLRRIGKEVMILNDDYLSKSRPMSSSPVS